jgi:hypothetical protein
MDAEQLAHALGATKPPRRTARGPTWTVHCPRHDDRHPSCDVTDAGGVTLIHCWICDQRDLIDELVARGLWRTVEVATRPPAAPIDWGSGESQLQPCCQIGPEDGQPTCQHWRAFEVDLTLARMRGNLFEAKAQIVELYRAAKYPLDEEILQADLNLAVKVGGSQIVPWHLDARVVQKAIDLVVAGWRAEVEVGNQ